MSRGFTLVELVICLAIFAIMTALVVVKYGNFNQSTLLTDTAYDIALVLHTAQSYGLSVKNAGVSCAGASTTFNCAYGVNFGSSGSISCGTLNSNATNITLFADTYPVLAPDHICTANDLGVTSYALTRGAQISCLYVGSAPATCVSGTNSVSELDVTFLRPNPDATICGNGSSANCSNSYGQITLRGSDGSLRTIGIYRNGQIVVNE